MAAPQKWLSQLMRGKIGTMPQSRPPYRKTTSNERPMSIRCRRRTPLMNRKAARPYTMPLAPMWKLALAVSHTPTPLPTQEASTTRPASCGKKYIKAVPSTRTGMELFNTCSMSPCMNGEATIPMRPCPLRG